MSKKRNRPRQDEQNQVDPTIPHPPESEQTTNDLNVSNDTGNNENDAEVVLNDELIKKLEAFWSLSDERTMSDKEIADALSIEYKRLEKWLTRNVKNLVGIRARARGKVKAGYLSRLNRLAIKAEATGKFLDSAKICFFLLERQFPKEYGRMLKLQESKSADWLANATEDEIKKFIADNQQILDSLENN